MSAFMSKVSHELRTPLNAILGFSQLLETEPGLPDRPRAWAHQLLASGRHLLALVDDVLDLSGVQSGLMNLDREPVALAPVLQECHAMLGMPAQAQGLRWTVAIDPALAVEADRRRVKQVLANLLSNAIKYNRAGGEVRVTARRIGDAVEIAIGDDGPGLDAEQRARLFTPFDRLGAERGVVAGTGLGLALSRQLALGMDGDITVDSRPGAGSTFTVRLPAAGLSART
jgi:signal transduction histidine kinase